jgi:hypothetical protein
MVSPSLQPSDFVNLDERALVAKGGFGTTVMAIGGDVFDLAFRNVYTTQIAELGGGLISWEWDRSTGFLLHYFNSLNLPYQVDIIDTNVWKTPAEAVYKPIYPLTFLLNLYLLLAETGGLYFTYWELWAASAAGIFLYVFQGWFRKLLDDRKRLLATPNLSKLLDKINSQEKKVLFLDDRKQGKVG